MEILLNEDVFINYLTIKECIGDFDDTIKGVLENKSSVFLYSAHLLSFFKDRVDKNLYHNLIKKLLFLQEKKLAIN